MLLCVTQEEMSSADKKDDPFTRRKCQPTLVTLVCTCSTINMHNRTDLQFHYVSTTPQAFRESAMPEATELLQQLAEAKTEEDKEAIKAAVVSLLTNIHETGQTDDVKVYLWHPCIDLSQVWLQI